MSKEQESTMLASAEKELNKIQAANVERRNSPSFGYESRAVLTGEQVNALITELNKLRSRAPTG